MKFKIGDKVRIIANGSHHAYKMGQINTIMSGGDNNWYLSTWHGYVYDSDIELLVNKNNMNIKEKFITAFLSEPEKSFR